MKKFTKLLAGLTAIILTFGAAGCSKSVTYPNFVNSPDSMDNIQTSEKYVVNVTSEGGLKLDGIVVNAKKNGQVVRSGISRNGRIEFLVSLDEYDLEVDPASLPAGYSAPDVSYKTNANEREEVNIKISSSVITDSSVASSFTVGSIIHDFTFRDCYGTEYNLAALLKTKKAVALNFFFTSCGPCRSEFPAIEKAYAANNDIALLALAPSQRDNSSSVMSFKEDMNLSFPMGIDNNGLISGFGISSFPTTVIVDRYGMIAYRSMGSDVSEKSWARLFERFTADDYVQRITGSTTPGEDDNPDDPTNEREKPDVTMPDTTAMLNAGCDSNLDATFRADDDDEYSWPWLAHNEGDEKYIYSSNKGKGNSYSQVFIDIPMTEGQVLSFDYNVSSETGNDLFHVLLNGNLLSGFGWSGQLSWRTFDAYVSDCDQTVELAFVYQKDPADPTEEGAIGDDVVKVRNLHLSDSVSTPTDVLREAVKGAPANGKGYSQYVTPVKGEDGFYHVNEADGALLYISINQLTPWSDAHTDSATSTSSEGTVYYNTLYPMTYYRYSQSGEGYFHVELDGKDLSDVVLEYWNIQGYMEAPYYLLPVNDELREWAESFAKEYERDNNNTYYAEEWLEFCFYYDHYNPKGVTGDEHADGVACRRTNANIRGLTRFDTFEAYEKSELEAYKKGELDLPIDEKDGTYNKETGRNVARINYALQGTSNGSYYTFTASKKGVYQIRSYTDGCSGALTSAGTPSQVVPDLRVFNTSGDFIRTTGNRDFDMFLGEVYEGFNYYVTLDEGEQVYLYLQTATAETGYYDFEIEYKGETYDKMFVCSTGDGAWTYDLTTSVGIYLAISVRYDEMTDCYYAADGNGNPDYSRPIYIAMVGGSFLMSNLTDYNYWSLERLIGQDFFGKYVLYGDELQARLEVYLGQALAKDADDPTYGMVLANAEIVTILNEYISQNVDGGRGVGNGWLMFAAYEAHLGE